MLYRGTKFFCAVVKLTKIYHYLQRKNIFCGGCPEKAKEQKTQVATRNNAHGSARI